MDISAFVPPQDLRLGRRAARLAVQCVYRNVEEHLQGLALIERYLNRDPTD